MLRRRELRLRGDARVYSRVWRSDLRLIEGLAETFRNEGWVKEANWEVWNLDLSITQGVSYGVWGLDLRLALDQGIETKAQSED